MNKVFASKNMMRINGTKILEIDTVDFIEFRMDQMGWTQKDLIPFLGSKERVSEVMNRKRGISIQMMRNLYFGMGVPSTESSPTEVPEQCALCKIGVPHILSTCPVSDCDCGCHAEGEPSCEQEHTRIKEIPLEKECKHDGDILLSLPPRCAKCGEVIPQSTQTIPPEIEEIPEVNENGYVVNQDHDGNFYVPDVYNHRINSIIRVVNKLSRGGSYE